MDSSTVGAEVSADQVELTPDLIAGFACLTRIPSCDGHGKDLISPYLDRFAVFCAGLIQKRSIIRCAEAEHWPRRQAPNKPELSELRLLLIAMHQGQDISFDGWVLRPVTG